MLRPLCAVRKCTASLHKMRLFLDENIPLSVCDALQHDGYDVEHVRQVGLRGAVDIKIAAYAKKQQAILVTKDLEFGNVMVHPIGNHFGVIILRFPHHFRAADIHRLLTQFLGKVDVNNLAHSITVLEVGKYRIRRFEEK
jgi:predicted nuclease of predicted toxin-antitoxin system